MDYTIKPHRVACILSVVGNGSSYECMYMSEGRIECRRDQCSVNDYSTVHFYALPDSVRNAVAAHFENVFSIPNDGRRGKFVDSLKDVSVNAD